MFFKPDVISNESSSTAHKATLKSIPYFVCFTIIYTFYELIRKMNFDFFWSQKSCPLLVIRNPAPHTHKNTGLKSFLDSKASLNNSLCSSDNKK